jgi:probable DNA repair protein
MPSALTLANLLDRLARGERLLLPSARAARELRAAFDAHQRMLGLAVWEPAPALSWQQWTGSLWSELIVTGADTRLLLNPAQEHSLWREIIAEDNTHSTLGSPDSLADLARSAWALAAAYHATSRLRGTALNYDCRIFSEWADAFNKRCAKEGYLSPALLDDALRQHIATETVATPEKLQLAGFGDLTPAQQSLLAALRERGCAVEFHNLAAEPTAAPLRASVIAETPRAEIELAARWIRNYLEEHRDAPPRVAILVPHLAEERAELDSVLREILATELQSIATDLSSAPWEISAGAPLASLAMISAALELAQWTRRPLSIERVGSLLLSPFLGHATERDALARFDANTLRRRKLLRPEIDIAELLRLLLSRDPDAPQLAAWLREVHALAQRAASIRTATYAEWMEHIRALLVAAQWPITKPEKLTAARFEATRAWDAVLDLVSTLDFAGRRVPFEAALHALELQVQSTLFTPPATHAPVQVMSIAEAEGCLFDAVVFLHATDANWPAPERANPLLPWRLQSSLAMPGTDAARTTDRARTFTAALLARTGAALFTSAAEDNDGKLRPSPLLAEFALTQLSAEQLCPSPAQVPHIEPELIADNAPLPPLMNSEVRGGAAVLQAQAACGFRAFAEFRLHSSSPETRDLGLDARDSGNHVHLALEAFWKQVKSQKQLRNTTPERIESILRNCIDTALERHFTPRGPWDTAYLDLQRRRLHKLLQQWLELELERGPFEVIDAERKTKMPVGPLVLDLRLDRMDRVGDEAGADIVLVDYKTGSASPKKWEGLRPDEPQLPLYALYPSRGTVKAVTFANVRAGKDMKWSGYQAEDGILPKARDNRRDLNLLIEEWRATLTQLAQDFADGKAFVAPKDYPKTCKYCEQRLVCRLDPATLHQQEDEEEESDG